MRLFVLTCLTAALPQLIAAQTASQNYILSRRPLNTAGTAAIETVTYVDGLGRPVETVQKGAAPDGGDIVSMKEYDGLDLPAAIAFNNKNLGGIKHTYLADGTRIRTDHISSSGNLRLNAYTEYHGNHIYENRLLSMTLFDGGFVSYTNGDASKPSFHYYVKDHLGSNRVVLADDGTVEQVNDYYPFGALMSNGWTNASSQKYKYIGKELDCTFGYDMYDTWCEMEQQYIRKMGYYG